MSEVFARLPLVRLERTTKVVRFRPCYELGDAAFGLWKVAPERAAAALQQVFGEQGQIKGCAVEAFWYDASRDLICVRVWHGSFEPVPEAQECPWLDLPGIDHRELLRLLMLGGS